MAITRGLVLGKFMPPHSGHLHLIRAAAKQVDELTILVCSIYKDPIPGSLRYYWLKEIFPELRVIHVKDENPKDLPEDQYFWKIWKDTVQKNCPNGVDIVFSGWDYGDQLPDQLNAQHILINPDRKEYPVTGAMIRKAPYKYWNFIPEVVRSYFIKRVVLTGPESVGKSVLAKKLAAHFKTNWVVEYGREYCERIGNVNLTSMDFAHIAAGQLLKEDEAARASNKLLFCDTDLIVTQIWAEVFIENAPLWIYEMNHLRRYDLFILLEPDIPWIDDGTRNYGDIRDWQFDRLKEELVSRNLNYCVIKGDFDARLTEAIQQVERLLSSGTGDL